MSKVQGDVLRLDHDTFRFLHIFKHKGYKEAIANFQNHAEINNQLAERSIFLQEVRPEEIRIVKGYSFENTISAPLTVFLEVTRACNAKCRHCFNNSSVQLGSEMSITEIQELVYEMRQMGVFSVKITGGEPFCREDLFDIVNLLEQAEISYIIFTNGILLSTGKYIKRLQELEYLKSVRVSIDGLEDINDNVRGDGTFKKAFRALDLLKRNNIECELNYIINKLNYKHIDDLVVYVSKNLSCKINLGMIKISGRALDNMTKLVFDSNEIEDCIIEVTRQLSNQDYIKKYRLLEDIFLDLCGDHFGCPGGQFTCIIDPRGNVFPCGLLSAYEQFNCGNVRQNSFYTIWRDNLVWFRSLEPNNQCAGCKHFKNGCVGACRANAFNWNGDIEGTDPNCKIFVTTFI